MAVTTWSNKVSVSEPSANSLREFSFTDSAMSARYTVCSIRQRKVNEQNARLARSRMNKQDN